MKKPKGKEWRRKAMAGSKPKEKQPDPGYDPTLSNHKRHQLRKARRAYLIEQQVAARQIQRNDPGHTQEQNH